MYNEAIRTKKLLERKRATVCRKMSKLPKAAFQCHMSSKNSNIYDWYVIEKNGDKNIRRYISKKNRKYAEQLAQRAYLEKHLGDIDNELEAVNRYLRKHKQIGEAEKFANKNAGYLDLIKPLFESNDTELHEWATNYRKLDFKPENLVYTGLDGGKYRSKSESILATRLYERGLVFRYECAVELANGKIVYPDFVIKNPKTGEIFIWEHLGMMNVSEYFESNIKKIIDYANSGFTLNKNLIITIEDADSYLDIKEIDRLIDQIILGIEVV